MQIVRNDNTFNLEWCHVAPFSEPYGLVEMEDLGLCLFIGKHEVKVAPLGYTNIVAKIEHNGVYYISDEEWLDLLIRAEEGCEKLFRKRP